LLIKEIVAKFEHEVSPSYKGSALNLSLEHKLSGKLKTINQFFPQQGEQEGSGNWDKNLEERD